MLYVRIEQIPEHLGCSRSTELRKMQKLYVYGNLARKRWIGRQIQLALRLFPLPDWADSFIMITSDI